MKKPTLCLIALFFISHAGFSETYVWEGYDDFSGSSLDSSKWGTKYLGGGIEPYVSGGKLILSATSGNPSATKVVKSGWEDIFQGDDGGQAWVYPKDSDIVGIEAEFLIPSSTSSMSGLALGVASLYPLSYATAELNADPNSASQYSQGFGFYHLANDGSEVENFGTTQRDTTHRLGATLIDGIIKLYVDGEIRYQGEAGTFNTDMFYINGFNDYQSQGLAFELTADNARVLRRVTTTNLDGSVLMLSSADDVSETLSFENGTFTSTFQDPTEGTFVDTDKSYILDEVSSDVWNITLEDGDTYSFDASSNSGTLVDYENGAIDTEGTWSFTFERHDWEDYDDFSSGSLDSSKWDVWWGAGGALAVVENGALKLSGSGNESDPASSVIPDDLTYTSNLPSKHSVALINQDDVYGVQAEFMIPANPSDDTGLNFIFFDWATDGSKEEFGPELEYRSESGLRTEFAYTDPESGEDEQITRPAEFGTYYKMSLIHTDTTNSMYLNGELIKEISSAGFVPDTIGFAAFNDDGLPYTTYVKNVRVLRRSQEITDPEPDTVTVVSDPSGNPVVVQVGDEYQWSSNLDGVTIWALGIEGEKLSKMGTAKFENGNKLIVFDIVDEVNGNETYNHPYIVDENGYIRVTESVYQYYNVVGVEDGAIRMIQDSNGLESVADDGINQVSMLYFTTRAAAEEYYYSKVNPKSWMWFDHYPWVYSHEEKDWLYFYPSGSTLRYWSNRDQTWRKFN